MRGTSRAAVPRKSADRNRPTRTKGNHVRAVPLPRIEQEADNAAVLMPAGNHPPFCFWPVEEADTRDIPSCKSTALCNPAQGPWRNVRANHARENIGRPPTLLWHGIQGITPLT